MKLHEWKTRIQSGEHLLGTMVTTFASADLPKILRPAALISSSLTTSTPT